MVHFFSAVCILKRIEIRFVREGRCPLSQNSRPTSDIMITYRIKPEELYILSCERVEAEGRGLFHS